MAMKTDMETFPEWIDSSLLDNFKACERKGYWAIIRKLKPKSDNIDLIAGGAIASAVEATRRAYFTENLSEEDSIHKGLLVLWKVYGTPILAKETKKTWNRVSEAFIKYLDRFPLSQSRITPFYLAGKLTIEFSFSVPIPGVYHPDTGQPILFCGRSDAMAKYKDMIVFVDEKTTSRMGPQWADQWSLRGQFDGYAWSAEQYGINVKATIIRGIGIYKDGVEFKEAIRYHESWRTQRWLESTQEAMYRMIQCWEKGQFPYNLGNACSQYGGCPYSKLCRVANPEPWIPQYYQNNSWNPLNVTKHEQLNLGV